ncbi:MAG TPA: nucleotidyltransferase family protein [Micromonosporaceae bacterium]
MAAETLPGADQLRALIRSSDWLLRVLETVRASGLPDAWVGAGALRDLVWGERYGPGFDPGAVRDVDVAYFDPHDLSRQRDDSATAALEASWSLPWEARNQAAVHTWYHDTFGGDPVAPFRSIAEAIATWPETATAVVVRLDASGEVAICAPYGLADLLGGVWRRNPARVSVERSIARLARHRPELRWPGVTVIRPDQPAA